MSVSIRLQIKTMYNDFSPKEQAIADYILENPSKVSHSPISNLASELGIADSTFFQFTKKLGYNGFKDFKMAMLIQENDLSAISIHENIQKTDTELTMAQKVFESSISTLNDTKKLLQQKDLKKAATIINESKRVYFFGVGGSEIVATDAYHKFLRSPIATGSGFFGSARVVQNINSRWVRTYVIASLEKVVLVLFELLVRCDNKVSIQ